MVGVVLYDAYYAWLVGTVWRLLCMAGGYCMTLIMHGWWVLCDVYYAWLVGTV